MKTEMSGNVMVVRDYPFTLNYLFLFLRLLLFLLLLLLFVDIDCMY